MHLLKKMRPLSPFRCVYQLEVTSTKCIKSDLRFLDSLNFMTSELDAHAQTLSYENPSLLKQKFSPDAEEMFKKIRRKGFSPIATSTHLKKLMPPIQNMVLTGSIRSQERLTLLCNRIRKLMRCIN